METLWYQLMQVHLEMAIEMEREMNEDAISNILQTHHEVDKQTQQYRQQVLGQITTIINTTVCHNESLYSRLVFDARVVKTGVQHNDGEWQHIARVWIMSTHTHTQLQKATLQ